jgi:hypothetical protein
MRTASDIFNEIELRLEWRRKYGGATAENPDMILLLEAVSLLHEWVQRWVQSVETASTEALQPLEANRHVSQGE